MTAYGLKYIFLVVNVGYIIASFIAIFITTLIVYKVANNLFGLGLHLKPLLLCAVCAMLISLVLPKIIVGFAGLPATLAVLAVFAVVFAYFVARYEDMPQPNVETDAQAENGCDFGDTLAASIGTADTEIFEEHDSSQLAYEIDGNAGSGETISDAAGVLSNGQEVISLLGTEMAGNNLNKGQLPTEEESLNDVQITQEYGIVPADNIIAPDDSTIVLDDNYPEPQQHMGDSQIAAEIVENGLIEQAADTVGGQNNDEDFDSALEWDNAETDILGLRVEHNDAVDSNFAEIKVTDLTKESVQIDAEVLVQMPNEEVAGQVDSPVAQAFMQEVDDNSMNHDELSVNPVQIETEELDELIDYAFVCKETKDYNNAYKSFKKAFVLYPNSEAAPFLVVEIGNILKNKGDYDGAIKIFSEGRNLSYTKHDEMMEQEFISTIAYLRITQNILLQNRLGNMPFLQIPTQILNQIDEEFREWRNVGNI